MKNKTIKPDFRERIIEKGVETLSDKELIAVLLRTGVKGCSVSVLAEKVKKAISATEKRDLPFVLAAFPGIGKEKQAVILSALELGRRFYGSPGQIIKTAKDVYEVLRHYAFENQEHFICIALNGAHEILEVRVVSIGTVNKTLVHPREVFSSPLKLRSAAIIISHNHPSGQLSPSQEDIQLTLKLKEAGELLGIPVLDHVIISKKGFYSITV